MFLFERSLTRGTESGTKFVKYIRYLSVLFLFVSFLVLSCKEDVGGLVSLHGKWVSEHNEVFIINLSNNTYQNPANGEWGDYTVNGDIREIARFNSEGSIGILYIEITTKGDAFETDGTGNFTGIHFKYLNDATVEFSTAANSSYKTPVYSTLASAKSALNENTLGTYFAMGSACTKQ